MVTKGVLAPLLLQLLVLGGRALDAPRLLPVGDFLELYEASNQPHY